MKSFQNVLNLQLKILDVNIGVNMYVYKSNRKRNKTKQNKAKESKIETKPKSIIT